MTTDPQPIISGSDKDEPISMQEENQQGGTIDPDDPLLIAQTLTYVTDNGSVVMTYSSAPFTTGKEARQKKTKYIYFKHAIDVCIF
jgi:hypothetical protein